ncbi:MAG: tetratricopeptide repeat protein [Deltaproteobacteria bacterium]|nr:tetratricopeptide repeat protein [Deltaproteobacteria bacterium]
MTDQSSPTVTIQRLLEEGRAHIQEKTPSQARSRFAEAWTLATSSSADSLAVEAALMLAVVEPQKAQQGWIERAITLAEKSQQADAKRWLGGLYTSLGWKLFDLRQYEAAVKIFQKSLDHFTTQPDARREIFVTKWSIGKLLRVMGRTDEALAMQNALLAELGAGDPKDGRLFEELAECLHALKRTVEAQTYFELAYRELYNDQWIIDNQPATLKRLKELGKFKMEKPS